MTTRTIEILFVAAVRVAVVSILAGARAFAQEPTTTPPATRADAIAQERAEKLIELWPERQSPAVNIANGWLERGLKEGLDTGRGANGLQVVLGDMRAAQGLAAGLGYRRSDLFRERLGYRGTVRGTIQGAYMVDFTIDFQSLHTQRTRLRWYSKYEHSPAIDYFGSGSQSTEDRHTSFLYNDGSSDFDASFEPVRFLHIGATGGYYHAHTGESDEGLPPVSELFPPGTLPGFQQDTHYTRIGVFAFADSRDSLTGPRSGGVYGVRYREYWDVDRRAYAFRQTEWEFQQYLPYFNRSRVLALRGAVVLSFPKEGDVLPFYLQPTLGGSDELRGYVPYRFRDNHALALTVEHRWHVLSLLDMALFADAGKVAARRQDLNLSDLRYSGGLGFRFRIGSAVVGRVDLAKSPEGFRFIGTFGDAFLPKW